MFRFSDSPIAVEFVKSVTFELNHVPMSFKMQRRTVLVGAAASAAGLLSGTAAAADNTAGSLASPEFLLPRLERFRASIPAHFDRTYVENAVIPFFLTSIYDGERPALPMIDVTLRKENALPR